MRIRSIAFAWLVFGLLGVGLYASSLDHPFHYDDHHSIEYNKHLRSLGNIPLFFTDLSTFSSEPRGMMFRPLLLTTYAINYFLHEDWAFGFRLVNLWLHVTCSTLLFALVVSCAGSREAWAFGLVFLLHPIHSEPVNYISSRSDLLVACCYLTALLWATRRPAASVGAYIAGLLTKSVAITLPGAVVIWTYIAGVRWRRDYLASLGLVSAGYLGLIVSNRFLSDSMAKAPRPFAEQLWTQCKGLVYSLWLCIMPHRLSVEHAFDISKTWMEPTVACAGLLLLSLAYATWKGRRRVEAWGGGFFALVLLPTTLIPLNILVSERRLYLASAGLIGVVIWAWGRLALRQRRSALVLGLGFCLVLSSATWARNPFWASDIALWEDAVAKGPNAFRARANLGLAYGKAERWSEAQYQLEQALAIKPDYADAWVELGNIYHDTAEIGQAENAYRRALAVNPSLEGVYYNLGNLALGSGRIMEAITLYHQTLGLNQEFVDAYNNLGQAYEASGETDAAIANYRMATEHDPDFGGAWFNLGVLYETQFRYGQALTAMQRAEELLVSNPEHQSFANRAAQAVDRLLEKLADRAL